MANVHTHDSHSDLKPAGPVDTVHRICDTDGDSETLLITPAAADMK